MLEQCLSVAAAQVAVEKVEAAPVVGL
jgi:hypothetical protein